MLRLPHSTRGGWKGGVLTICNHLQILNQLPWAREELCCPRTQQRPACTGAHGGVGVASPPHSSVTRVGSRSLQGQKELSRQTSKGKERKAEVGPNPTSYPTQSRGGIPGWTHRKIMEDEWPCEIHVFISLQSPPSGHADTLRHHQ